MAIIETVDELILTCILKGRHLGQEEVWRRFVAACNKHGVIPIEAQARTALNTLRESGRIEYVKGKGVRRLS